MAIVFLARRRRPFRMSVSIGYQPGMGNASLASTHKLRDGWITRSAMDRLLADDVSADQVAFHDQFYHQHAPTLSRYARRWGRDPIRLWSRRWEYPWHTSRLRERVVVSSSQPFRLLDAGSGVTYWPFFLTHCWPPVDVTCVDSDASFERLFRALLPTGNPPPVRFRVGTLHRVDAPADHFDAVSCISVLEHTCDHRAAIDEFRRVLKPGGLLTLSFDVSLDGKFQLLPSQARDLLRYIAQYFDLPLGDWQNEFAKLDSDRSALLTTDAVRKTAPELLPFAHPLLLGTYDLLRGKGWTGGFRSAAVFCVSGTKRA
jgi:SAM-dependent methyltransferase